MQIIINIPEEIYEIIQNSTKYIDEVARVCEDAVKMGTPLPKTDTWSIKDVTTSKLTDQ